AIDTVKTPELRLYGPSGNFINPGGNPIYSDFSTSVFNQPAASSGTYYIVASGHNVDDSGAYKLYFAKFPGTPAADADGEGGAIVSGQTKTANINNWGDFDIYTFTASAGDTFSVSMGELAIDT